MVVEDKIKETVFGYLPPNEYQVFLFGSRAKGTNRKWSDYDVGVLGKEKIPYRIIARIENDLAESDIPFRVDVVDFNRVSDKFRNIALRNIEIWTKK